MKNKFIVTTFIFFTFLFLYFTQAKNINAQTCVCYDDGHFGCYVQSDNCGPGYQTLCVASTTPPHSCSCICNPILPTPTPTAIPTAVPTVIPTPSLPTCSCIEASDYQCVVSNPSSCGSGYQPICGAYPCGNCTCHPVEPYLCESGDWGCQIGFVCDYCDVLESISIGPATWRCVYDSSTLRYYCQRPDYCSHPLGCYVDGQRIYKGYCASSPDQCDELIPTPTPPPTTPAPTSPPYELPTPPPSRVFCDHSYPPQPVATPPDPNNPRMYTAVGCIPVGSARAFIGWVLLWIVGIAGGIALILIVYAGFMIITSTGNPQRVQAGKELLTAAISGLAVLLFGIFILEFIGVNILNIPGFGR
jgi:hypothetical protein